jgi:hypothetical protein
MVLHTADSASVSAASRGALGAGTGHVEVVQLEASGHPSRAGDAGAAHVEKLLKRDGVDGARVTRAKAPAPRREDAGQVQLRLVDADKTQQPRSPSASSTAVPEKSTPPMDPLPGREHVARPVVLPLPPLPNVPAPKAPEAAPVPVTQEATRGFIEALDAEPTVHPALDALRTVIDHPAATAATGLAPAGSAKTIALTGFALERLLQNPKASNLVRRFLNGRALVLRLKGGALKLQLVTPGSVHEGGVLHIGASNETGDVP